MSLIEIKRKGTIVDIMVQYAYPQLRLEAPLFAVGMTGPLSEGHVQTLVITLNVIIRIYT